MEVMVENGESWCFSSDYRAYSLGSGEGKKKNSRQCISEVGMQEGKLIELERFQLIPSQHFEVSLLSYFKDSKSPPTHISPIQTEASVLKYVTCQINIRDFAIINGFGLPSPCNFLRREK